MARKKLSVIGTGQTDIKFKSYCLLILLGFFALLLVALDVLVGSFIYVEFGYNNTGFYQDFTNQFSLPCNDLSLSPDEDYETFDINKDKLEYSIASGRYICSFNNLTGFLHKFVERTQRQRLAKGLAGQSYLQCGDKSLKPSSGYLTATFNKVSSHQHFKDKRFDQIVHWDRHQSSGFIVKDLQYHKGKVLVSERRFYFVYSSVHINLSRSLTPKDINILHRFSIQICASQLGQERTLLYKTNAYNTSKTNVVSSINVGGHVLLDREEEVYVKVSDIKGLIHNSKGNTFAIFPLE